MEHDTQWKKIGIKHDQELSQPGHWLVAGLDWPGGGRLAEAAFAVAPELIPRDRLSNDAYQVLGCAELYASKHAVRVVLFSDLTRMFASAGHSWAALGVDWQAALDELRTGPYPAMFLAITERAHLLICDPSETWPDDERDLVRQAVASKLTADWRSCLRRTISSDPGSRGGH